MANETKTFFKELKDATFDYNSFFKTIGKDFLILAIIGILTLAYTLFLLSTTPVQPEWAKGNNLVKTSALELQLINQELSAYLIKFTLLTILLFLVSLLLITLLKEWVWKDLAKEKHVINSFLKFLGLNTIIYLIITIIIAVIGVLAGLFVKLLATNTAPLPIIIFFAFLFLFPIVFLVFHFLNYSAYRFVKTRKFGSSIIDTFKSFSKTKQLLAPYSVIMLFFIIVGTLVNIIITKQDLILNLIMYLLIFIFLSWEKVYSSHFFKRIYN